MAHRILVISGDDASRRLAAEQVASWGCQVVAAEDVLTGIRAIRAEAVDAVVTTFDTPRGSARDLLSWVRLHGLEIPVFVVSRSWKAADRDDSLAMGAKVFAEPCDWEDLRRQVTGALKKASGDRSRDEQ